MSVPTYRKPLGAPAVTYFDSGHSDKRGRKIGARVTVLQVQHIPITSDDMQVAYYVDVEPGIYTEVQVQKTKDEKKFGSSQRRHLFSDVLAADNWVAKRLAFITKEASKQVGATVTVGARVELHHDGKQVRATVTGLQTYGRLTVRIEGESMDREAHLSTVALLKGAR